ncbi:MAG: bifunctional diaminohydroxyphosphoribosylaminopyrimidine deaminase/5-amino-6-(5-phosphoribosylamino)uracil reductase RibD [Chthoniobacterales bacterium]
MKAATHTDLRLMRLALEEASRGLGQTSPNPPVGAVIAKNARVLASGFHRAAGQPHAEIEALRSLSSQKLAVGATIYVTLEPCSTCGKTPACTDAILAAGIKRVVYAVDDPNPAHAGRARHIFEKAGIEVLRGVLSQDASSLLRPWTKFTLSEMPYVIAKAAMSLDGKITSHPEARWLTSVAARCDAMKLRSRVDAILIGGRTLRTDNPSLTLRGREMLGKKQPLRVVWTRGHDLPMTAKLFTDSQKDKTLILRDRSLRGVLKKLAQRGVVSVLIEGGGFTLGKAFDARLVDEICWYIAPEVLGGPIAAVGGRGVSGDAKRIFLDTPHDEEIGRDLKVTARVRQTAFLDE